MKNNGYCFLYLVYRQSMHHKVWFINIVLLI
uniref:Uncharacterized protein n=1 Tax=Rhizophora mucronata TaxID=61149 RepID=A0A2P2PXT9_RHIMU